jgi:hypothetical protein
MLPDFTDRAIVPAAVAELKLPRQKFDISSREYLA